ncbi:hypothetical protein CLU81_1221 [Flavobacterium sp. 9]|uniref:hypothetical protein n=1 Tax=Flavobacterium sp. 9 TaxID=2035198 RepID=UPI000C3D1F87|nr:hypothetical protein [Flavobacterium sp. 9]PIF30772.1 hypothetical protein CLU81_1221 [Flavobacterium sp. 9]
MRNIGITKLLFLFYLCKVHVTEGQIDIDDFKMFFLLIKKLEIMNLESLKLDKFKDCTLKREQLFELNGGGMYSTGSNICAPHGASQRVMNFDYGYDSYRGGEVTFHDRSNIKDICDNGFITADKMDTPLRPVL